MNQRNVEALALLLREFNLGIEESDEGCGELEIAACRYAAELLASRGVLVPSVLTLPEILPYVDGWTPSAENDDVAAESVADLVQGLERIAKGET